MINEASQKPIISNMTNNGAAETAQQGMEPKGCDNVTLQLQANDSGTASFIKSPNLAFPVG